MCRACRSGYDRIQYAFIGRIEANAEKLSKGRLLIYVGDGCPDFAESYHELVADCSSKTPDIPLTEDDYGAIYFSSGTTGFPKAILHKHQSLTQVAEMEQKHHSTGRDDVFFVYSAIISYRSQVPLDGKFGCRQQGGVIKRNEAGYDLICRF